MAIRDDSYSSVGEVLAVVRRTLDGAATFDTITRPTRTEVEKFIDRASGTLNICLQGAGFSTPISNSTAKLALDDWVTAKAAMWVELTQAGDGLSGFGPNNRAEYIASLMGEALELCENPIFIEGLKEAGVTVSRDSSEGLTFTALKTYSQRTDPTVTTREQPKFRRGLFDN